MKTSTVRSHTRRSGSHVRTHTRRVATIDEHTARELELFMDNDGGLYEQKVRNQKLLVNRKANGSYDHEKSVRLWEHFVDVGAVKYAREIGGGAGTAGQTFDRATRRHVARAYADEFETEYKLGNYDQYLSKINPTRKQIESLRDEALAAGDSWQVDICDLALAAHETTDSQGGKLIGPDGKVWTRTQAREVCAQAITER